MTDVVVQVVEAPIVNIDLAGPDTVLSHAARLGAEAAAAAAVATAEALEDSLADIELATELIEASYRDSLNIYPFEVVGVTDSLGKQPAVPQNYNTGGGTATSLSNYATSGLIPGVAGTTYVIDITGAAALWVINNSFVYYANTDDSFHSANNTGATYTNGTRRVVFTVPVGAEKFAVNFRLTSGTPTGADLLALMQTIKVNVGTTPTTELPLAKYLADDGQIMTEVLAAVEVDLGEKPADGEGTAFDRIAALRPYFDERTSANLYLPVTDPALALPFRAQWGAYWEVGNSYQSSGLPNFGMVGMIGPLNIGDVYTVSLPGAPASVIFNSTYGLKSIDADGTGVTTTMNNGTTVIWGSGSRSVTFTAQKAYASLNVSKTGMTEAEFDLTLAALMVNTGATALPYEPPVDPDEPLKPGPEIAGPGHGVSVQIDAVGGYYYARSAWSATLDKVQRFGFAYTQGNDNGLWDYDGEKLIPVGTPDSFIIAAYTASNLRTRSGGDESPPFYLNGQFLAGGHAPICRLATITAHDMRVGSQWSDGVVTWVVGIVVDANNVKLFKAPTGSSAAWATTTPSITGTTLTHVAGNLTTGSRTVAAQSSSQLWPFIQGYTRRATLDGRDITGQAGPFGGEKLRFHERYTLPNYYDAAQFIITNVGVAGNSLVNAAVPGQIEFGLVHSLDWTGVVQTVHTARTLIAYAPGQYGPGQFEDPFQPAGSVTTAYVPGTKSFNPGSGAVDFEAGVNITSNSTDFLIDKTTAWNNTSIPPDTIVMVNSVSSVGQYGIFAKVDDAVGEGKVSIRQNMTRALRVSGEEKGYLMTGAGSASHAAGSFHESVGLIGSFNPALDTALTWVVPYPRGAKHAISARAPGALALHWVPADARHVGQPVTLLSGGAVVTLLSEVVDERGILVTWSGRGEMIAEIG